MDQDREPGRWQQSLLDGADSLFGQEPRPDEDGPDYRTLTYEVTGRVARITFNHPEHGNAITADTPGELAHTVERADLDPRVHVMLVSGRGSGFCGGYDLEIFAEHGMAGEKTTGPRDGTVLDPQVQAANHDPSRGWDPMLDYAMMSRCNRAFASLLHANKPTVAKLHGFCVAGGTDIALYADQIIAAPIPRSVTPRPGYGACPPQARGHTVSVTSGPSGCSSPATRSAVHRPRNGASRSKRRRPTSSTSAPRFCSPGSPGCLSTNFVMVKLALNSALLAQGVATSALVGTVFDGIARHTREGYSFAQRAATHGFREAVRDRDEPFGDHGRSTFRG